MPLCNQTSQLCEKGDAHGEPSLLHRIRGMWQFANLCQWIFIFGKAARIDESIDTELLERECLKPASQLLPEIALALLKLVSSQRGLTLESYEQQLRKQYLAKNPRKNPLGHGDDPVAFAELDIFTKIKTLQDLTQWAMIHPERLRERMDEHKDVDQTSWRIEPYGWDRYDRTYFVLDDNRIYRLVAPPTHVEQRKATKLRRTQKNRRSSKRLRSTASQELLDKESSNQGKVTSEGDDGLGRATWECVAVSLSEAHAFLNTLDNTQDENEKILRKQLERYLVPILVKQEEAMRRRELQREREALNLAMMANAKRSSRIANKVERQQRDEEAQEKKRQQVEAELAVQRDRAAQAKAEQERNLRMLSRQRRLQEREARRLQHEEELSHLSGGHLTNAEAKRTSQRRQQADIQRKRQVLQDIASEEDSWIFDCSCGLYGQIDDGNHSVACDRCNVWQHSRCLGIQEEQAEQSEFHFICLSCRRQDQERADDPKTFVKLKVRPSQLAPEASPNEVAGADADNEEVEIRADPSVQDHTLP